MRHMSSFFRRADFIIILKHNNKASFIALSFCHYKKAIAYEVMIYVVSTYGRLFVIRRIG